MHNAAHHTTAHHTATARRRLRSGSLFHALLLIRFINTLRIYAHRTLINYNGAAFDASLGAVVAVVGHGQLFDAGVDDAFQLKPGRLNYSLSLLQLSLSYSISASESKPLYSTHKHCKQSSISYSEPVAALYPVHSMTLLATLFPHVSHPERLK